MIVVTNAGANVDDGVARRYGIEICPQGVVVGGETFDTRERVSFDQADAWVRQSPEHPYVLGTTAKEFAEAFQKLAETEREILVIQGSRKLVKSFDSALSAARSLKAHPRFGDLRIEVVDSKATDAGVGLIVSFAAVAGAEGLAFDRVVRLVQRAVDQLRVAATVKTFDYLVRGGRASVVKARIAEFLRVRPLLGVVDGEVVPVGRLSQNADRAEKMAEHLADAIGGRGAVWAAIAHGGDAELAERVLERLRARLDVAWGVVTPLSVSTYLNSGPGAVLASVLRVDDLGWVPPGPLGQWR